MNNKTKLLIRIICFVLILSSSITALALNSMIDEENMTVDGSEDEVTITVPYNVAPGVEQVTLLAVKGGETPPLPANITDSDIVHIDQQSSEFLSFTFTVDKDRFDEENQYIHIKLGGTAIDSPDLVTMKILSSGYRISGTVSNAADAIDSGAAAIDEEANTAWKTTVELRPSFLSESVIATADVNAETKAFELTDIESGSYVLEIKRNGYLNRYVEITVNDCDLDIGGKPLYVGDFNNDHIVDITDALILYSKLGLSYGDPGYELECDISPNGGMDISDCIMLYSSLGLDVTYYDESVDFEK